jgi:DNA primase
VSISDDLPAHKGFEPRWFKGETRLLNSEERELLFARYGLSIDDIKRHRLAVCTDKGVNEGRLVVPIFNLGGTIRGYELRVFSGFISDVPKTLHYKHLDEPWIGWFSANVPYNEKLPVVLVEDAISAMKVAHQFVAVSLMGCNLSMTDLFEIEKATDNIILALDKDASAKALAFKNKYRFIAPNLRVMLLDGPDLKELTDGRINEMVSEAMK